MRLRRTASSPSAPLRAGAVWLLVMAGAAWGQSKDWGKRERPDETDQVKVETISCAMCAAKIDRVTYSVTEYERDTDYKVVRASFNAYPHVLLTCPKCCYTTYSFQIHKPITDEQRTAVRAALTPLKREFADVWDVPLSFTLSAAAATAAAFESPDGAVFEIHLLGSYIARDAKAVEAEREMQRRAVQCLSAAVEKEEAYRTPKMRYIAGEIYRRLESFKDALDWFGKARSGADPDLEKLIGRQEIATRDAMEKKDRPPKK